MKCGKAKMAISTPDDAAGRHGGTVRTQQLHSSTRHRLVRVARRRALLRPELVRAAFRVVLDVLCSSEIVSDWGSGGRGGNEPHTRYPRIPVEAIPHRRPRVRRGRVVLGLRVRWLLLLCLLRGLNQRREHRRGRHRTLVLRLRLVLQHVVRGLLLLRLMVHGARELPERRQCVRGRTWLLLLLGVRRLGDACLRSGRDLEEALQPVLPVAVGAH